jgi:hypothetical protein
VKAVICKDTLIPSQRLGPNGGNRVCVANEPGTNVDRIGVQWLKLRVEPGGALSYYQHGRIFDPAPTSATYYYFPSLAVNCASDILLGFSGSSSNLYISAFSNWRPAAGLIFDPPVMFREGTGHYPSDRWGDYSFTCVEPTDSPSFWTVQQFSLPGDEVWGTWIARLKR